MGIFVPGPSGKDKAACACCLFSGSSRREKENRSFSEYPHHHPDHGTGSAKGLGLGWMPGSVLKFAFIVFSSHKVAPRALHLKNAYLTLGQGALSCRLPEPAWEQREAGYLVDIKPINTGEKERVEKGG